jgi:hypothetical protein
MAMESTNNSSKALDHFQRDFSLKDKKSSREENSFSCISSIESASHFFCA